MTHITPMTAPILHGRYRIHERLGVGRLAVVYHASDERLQRPVLVHLLRQELLGQEQLRQRFALEAQLGARRSHPSLLEIYDSGEVAGRPFMVTEHVAGRPLHELGPLSPEEALLYFRQVVGAVAACHAAGAPHPPISSANVMVVGDGHVELVESWQLPPDRIAADIACYRAPERAVSPATPASVVYSLGLLLIEMLAGRRVIDGADARSIAAAHLTTRVPSLDELCPQLHAPSLASLIDRAVAREPADRWPDAVALSHALDDLHRVFGGETGRLTARPSRAPARGASPRPAPVPAPAPQPAPARAPQPLADAPPDDAYVVPPRGGRPLTGLLVMLALFLGVAVGAYLIAGAALERVADIRLPRPEVSLPDLPGWLTGVAGGSGEVLVVTIGGIEGLNVRAEPGLTTEVIDLLPNGARVRKLDGPRVVDNVPWVRVRAELSDRTVEGWVSERYVRPG